eukprot:scaffold16194_cov118-Skeletonema_dohrnii-CCMP3373.AAC.4
MSALSACSSDVDANHNDDTAAAAARTPPAAANASCESASMVKAALLPSYRHGDINTDGDDYLRQRTTINRSSSTSHHRECSLRCVG